MRATSSAGSHPAPAAAQLNAGQLGNATLNAATRSRGLHRLAEEEYDVIVVGGGVTGAGVALDSATRGLRTALVERLDLASGTSRWSSKLVHGGLRYLATGDVGVAWESASERHVLMGTVAPHLTRSVPNLIPLGPGVPPAAGIVTEVGLRLADGLRVVSRTSHRQLPRPRRISAKEAQALAPGLRRDLRGALLYWDGQLEDDARLVIGVARTAAAHGTDVVTRCEAVEIGERHAILRDTLTGETLSARGHVINATGVWADRLEPALSIERSRGSHIVVRATSVGHPSAIFTAPVPGHFGRFVFAMPQPDGLVIIGLTDEAAPGVDGTAPAVPVEDEEFLLRMVNGVLERPLRADDIVGRFAGVRPLVRTGDSGGATADVSRRHLVVDEPGRPVSIAGGKLTTYRRMAQDTVDAVCRRLGRDVECRTRSTPLVGAASPQVLGRVEAPPRLVRRYGLEAPAVAALGVEHPELMAPVSDTCPTLGVELLFGVLHEGALTVEDLIERRARVTFDESAVPAATALAERVRDLAAARVGSLP